jgi:hypothetical protein
VDITASFIKSALHEEVFEAGRKSPMTDENKYKVVKEFAEAADRAGLLKIKRREK